MPDQDNMPQALMGGVPPSPDEPLSSNDVMGQALINYGKAQAQHAWDLFSAPGRAYQGELSPEEAQSWGPQMAMALLGRGVAAAPEGAAGIFGGRLARTADLPKLYKAQMNEIKGATPEQNWHETGWFKGPEDKWKFEIPDAESRLSMDPPSTEKIAHILEHPELYEAYPSLKNIPVDYEVPPGAGAVHYHPEYGWSREQIGMSPGIDPDWTHRSYLHELQHGVQAREGFARGGSPMAPEILNVRDQVLDRHGYGLGDFPPGYFQNRLYERLAGETEARNVERRLRFHQHFPDIVNQLTDKTPVYQRPPWTTQDVHPSQAIVRHDVDYWPARGNP